LDKGEKEKVVAWFQKELEQAKLVVRFGFSGLKVEDFNALRREMGKVDGVALAVVKNTLAEIASRETDSEALFKSLTGPNAFLFAKDDIIEPTKLLVEFSKKKKKLVVFDGVLDGKLLSGLDVKNLASMPSREQLLGQLVYVVASPLSGFVNVLAGVPRALLNVLNAVKEEKDKAA
jgi:large subunit ribosomal protein L10